MGMKVKSSGNFKNTETFLLNHRKSLLSEEQLVQIAEKGTSMFENNTPSKSGKTAKSWGYYITEENKLKIINFTNSNIQNGINIAIIIDTGHATVSGSYVSGTHYIDKTIKDICKYINKLK